MTPAGNGHAAAVGKENPLLPGSAYKRWVVFVLLLVSIFNYADRAILAVLGVGQVIWSNTRRR